ncbi:glycosyltransferase family 4 protein [Gluconacetobacter asukensis]|uniref:Glycosyltransferase family 4 protein n=1 Tax=Gluconacetobacter asukensis TaxID=1017181 RepID=A0A7W4J1S2_9PROT|nr:glycosyltransferase family 4 protein [Gluconacetobacter asukensis]MBB2173118.1 glycosyltransferase family 4 protein [Gluconacetobacter asukensis]
MRIVYLTQWFDPETHVIKGAKFVRALQSAGHEVTVVTGFPNYPTGRLYPGYRLRLIHKEVIGGVNVVRLPLYPSHDSSSLRRSFNYLSFFLSALVYLLLRRTPFDIAYVYHPPITVGLAAAVAGLLRRLPFILDVQDLWPDTLAATGMAGGRRSMRLVGLLCRFVYRRSDAIVAQSEGMKTALNAHGVPADKLVTIRNWAEAEPPINEGEARLAPHHFVVVYGGNLGRAQDLGTVLDAAARLRERKPDILIRLYGGGVEAEPLRARAEALSLTNVEFHGPVSKDAIGAIFAQADALLVHLADHPLFAITVPSKVQAYLAMGRPIVAGLAGEAARLLVESKAAVVAPPGDPRALAEAIASLADMPLEARKAMGHAGHDYYQRHLSFQSGVRRTLGLFDSASPT